nr:DUF4158 domain-containing protein [Bacillus toyonensis]
MKRNWSQIELEEQFSLFPNEINLIMNKRTNANRLGFAILLKYFQQEARFPNDKHDVPTVVVQYVANQIDIAGTDFFDTYGWVARSGAKQLIEKKYVICLSFENLLRKIRNAFLSG